MKYPEKELKRKSVFTPGLKFWKRSRIGPGWWYIDPDFRESLFQFCDAFAVERRHVASETPVNPYAVERHSRFLDGGVEMTDGDYICGRRGTWVHGCRAFRFVLYELGQEQPRQYRFEPNVPGHIELARELAAQQERQLDRKAVELGAEYDRYLRQAACLERAKAARDLPPEAFAELLSEGSKGADWTLRHLLELDHQGRGDGQYAAQYRCSLWPKWDDPMGIEESRFRESCRYLPHNLKNLKASRASRVR